MGEGFPDDMQTEEEIPIFGFNLNMQLALGIADKYRASDFPLPRWRHLHAIPLIRQPTPHL